MLGTEELTYGRFRTLLFHLPRESAFVQAQLGEAGKWTTDNYLTAHVIDELRHLAVLFGTAYGFRPKPKFEPFSRPGVKNVKGNTKTYAKFDLEQLRGMLDQTTQAVDDG